jgi:hypothetical protein
MKIIVARLKNKKKNLTKKIFSLLLQIQSMHYLVVGKIYSVLVKMRLKPKLILQTQKNQMILKAKKTNIL